MDNANLDLAQDVILPGFRFHPTDEELVSFYLRRKVQCKPLPVEVITQLDIYKFHPWDLPKMAAVGEKEWFFFCPRERKYRNSKRPNRVTAAGFWKATGTDRPVYSTNRTKCIGLKKSLVFYQGRAAKGFKTDWIMHEFRLPTDLVDYTQLPQPEDSWTVCRIFKRSPSMQRFLHHPCAETETDCSSSHSYSNPSKPTEDSKSKSSAAISPPNHTTTNSRLEIDNLLEAFVAKSPHSQRYASPPLPWELPLLMDLPARST